MKGLRLYDCPDSLDGTEDYILGSFCFPNTKGWRDVVTTMFQTLQYGRSFDEATGNILDSISVGREIISTMSFCQLQDLIDAINNISINVSCGGGCGGGGCPGEQGQEEPSGPGDEGGPVPGPAWGDPPSDPGTGAYISRKCKVAWLLFLNYREVLITMKGTNFAGAGLESVLNFFGDLWVAAIAALVGYAVGEWVIPFVPILDGLGGSVVGFIYGLVRASVDEDVDIDALVAAMDANQDDLLCALAESTGVTDASGAFYTILNNYGVSTKNLAVIQTLLVADLLNLLYFSSNRMAVLEEQIENYTPPYPCPCGCGAPTVIKFGPKDNRAGQTLPFGQNVITAERVGGSGNYIVHIVVDPGGASCPMVYDNGFPPGPGFQTVKCCNGQSVGYNNDDLQGETICMVEIECSRPTPHAQTLTFVNDQCTGCVQ